MVGVGDRFGPYEIVARLGAGGMGEVFRARDERLGREVALKVISERVAGSPDARGRFEHEARAVAALSHPNIVSLYDIGREGDRSYVVMELVQGVTLRERLRKRVPVGQAIAFAAQTARAIAVAHEKGIIHRDLKPENIMVTPDDSVKVLDFGLARVIVSDADGVTMLTQPGLAVGTIGYSPPEQLRGETPDHRADIFSLGVILYEMVNARRPFDRPTSVDVISAILSGASEPLPESIPTGLTDIINRCLAPRPELRFPSARELAGALETVDFTTSGFGRPAAGPAERRPAAVVVMPFVDLSPQQDQAYLCDGIAEELTTILGRMPGLEVVSRSAAAPFRAGAADVREIGRVLNVTSVLEGGVRKAGDRLRVTVQLVDARSGRQQWSDRFDGELADVFAVQDAIADGVASALKVALLADSGRSAWRPTENVDAYTLYLKGRHEWNRRTEDGLVNGLSFFQQAIDADPGFAAAHAAVAETYVTLSLYGARPPADAMEHARASAETAVRLDPSSPEAHVALACVKGLYDWAWADAEREFKKALDLEYGHARVHQWYAINLLVPQARFVEAAREMQAAMAIEPLSPVISMTAALVPLYGGQFEQAKEAFGRTLALDPGFAMARYFLGQTHAALGNLQEALRELQTAVGLSSSPEVMAVWGSTLAQAGRGDHAREILEKLRALAAARYVSPCLLAQLQVSLGDTTAALASLAEAEAIRATDLSWIALRPVFRPLHAEPAFLELLDRIGVVLPRKR